MAEHAQVDVHALQMDYARQQANADQQYEQWVQNCDPLKDVNERARRYYKADGWMQE